MIITGRFLNVEGDYTFAAFSGEKHELLESAFEYLQSPHTDALREANQMIGHLFPESAIDGDCKDPDILFGAPAPARAAFMDAVKSSSEAISARRGRMLTEFTKTGLTDHAGASYGAGNVTIEILNETGFAIYQETMQILSSQRGDVRSICVEVVHKQKYKLFITTFLRDLREEQIISDLEVEIKGREEGLALLASIVPFLTDRGWRRVTDGETRWIGAREATASAAA